MYTCVEIVLISLPMPWMILCMYARVLLRTTYITSLKAPPKLTHDLTHVTIGRLDEETSQAKLQTAAALWQREPLLGKV